MLFRSLTTAEEPVDPAAPEETELEEAEAMAEKSKTPTAEQFSELSKRTEALEKSNAEKNELLGAQRKQIAQLESDRDRERSERFSERVDTIVKREFLDAGRVGPGQQEAITKLLRQHRGLERFSETDAAFQATVELLKDLIPAKTEGRPQ